MRKLPFIIALGALLGVAAYAVFPVRAGPMSLPPACNANPCVIKEDSGGYIAKFEELADRIVATGWAIHVDGECYSACTILMDRARPNVCITRNARLFIHKGKGDPGPERPDGEGRTSVPVEIRFDIEYSPDLMGWINANGGQPGRGGWLYMDYFEANKFWPNCMGWKPQGTPPDERVSD